MGAGLPSLLEKQYWRKNVICQAVRFNQGEVIAFAVGIKSQLYRGRFSMCSARVFKNKYRKHDGNDTGYEDNT